MSNLFYKLYKVLRLNKLYFVGFIFLFSIGLIFVASKLNLEEDITKLIPQSEKTIILNKVLKNVDFSDKIIINISVNQNGTAYDLVNYATELIDSLQIHCNDHIKDIQGEISDGDMVQTMNFITENLPFFLEDEDYKSLFQKFSSDSLISIVNGNYKTLVSPSGLLAKNTIRKDPFGLSFKGLKKLEALKISDNFDVFKGYLVTKNKKNLLLFIKPKLAANETDSNTVFVEKLYTISDDLNKKYQKKANSEYYGSTVVAVANAKQIKSDIQYTVSFALSILLIILIFFYKRFTIPILLFLPTFLGALVSVVSLYFIRDSISAISLGIGSILLGITLDYSLHVLTHYRNNNDIKQLYIDVTKPILMSSITTASAFLCLILLKSQALQDLGIFAAISVLSTSIFALIIIPLFYKPTKEKEDSSKNFIEKIASYKYDRNIILIGCIVLLLVVSFFTSKKVLFNTDLNSMNYQSEANLKAADNLESVLNLSSKSVYIVAYGENIDTVLNVNTKINQALQKAQKENLIIQYSSIGSLVLSKEEQLRKLKQWTTFWNDSLKKQLKLELINNGKNVGFKETTYAPFYKLIDKEYTLITLDEYSKVKPLLTHEYIYENDSLKTVVSLVKTDEKSKESLSQIINQIPNALLIDRKEISETFLGGLKDDFSTLINYSFIAVVLILFLFFKNIELTFLTIIPIALTWLLTTGVMGIFGIEFTIFNVIISTFIFGLGVDYSIFITNGLVKDYTYGTKELSTYKVSIILSVITTILGVGVLIFAKHPALKSISVLSLIGIFLTVFVAFTVQPLLFRIFVVNRAKKGFAPIKLRLFIHSFILSLIYGFGGMILSILSLIIIPLLPFSKKKKFKWLHIIMAKMVQLVLYANPFVKKKVINNNNETFKKPAIIIANHSSSLDTLTMGLITPKIIYLVNDWVYKSPIFGILARVAGFYPVSNGVDDSAAHLKEKVRQGYSLVVFPEGKRSFTNKIGRFHKGAFFLQQQLKIDILPIYLHGNSEVMPKNDFIIHDGSLTAKVGDRISYNDPKFGETYKERNKKISNYFKTNFLEFRNEIEGKNYYKDTLLSNYIYKDKSIEKLVNEDFKKNKDIYQLLNVNLPMKSKILHISDDYGQVDILLVSRSLDRKITTIINDPLKLKAAKNCYVNAHRKVQYFPTLSSVNIANFETLVLTKKNIVTHLNSIDLTNFKFIAIVHQNKMKSIFIELGYRIQCENDDVIFLIKND